MTKQEPRKEFDCVEMKRRGAEAIGRELEGRSKEQRLEYWRKKTAELRRLIAECKGAA